MMYGSLAAAADSFLRSLPQIDGHLAITAFSVTPSAGRFRDIFRDPVPRSGGVYWFYDSEGAVFDIGKSDENVWGRISAQAGAAAWHGHPSAGYLGTSGEGWGFPRSQHLCGSASQATIAAVKDGTFGVGWALFSPGFCSTLLEVYLQTLCRAVDGRLPELCKRVG